MVGGCCVCSDERGWAENPLVYCDGHACSVAVHQGTGVAVGGGGTRGAACAGRPRPRPPETSWSSGAPPPPHLKRREASGAPLARSWRTGSGIVFLPIVPVPRPPPQVEGVWGQSRGQ